VAGGLYLIWLGAKTITRPTAQAITAEPTPSGTRPGTGRATLARGIGVSGLNPKGLLLFLAILPQFTSPRGSWPLTVQLAVLGLVFTLTCAAFYLCVGSFANKILRARPGAARAITRFSGTAMIVIGALLLAERLLG
jgi:threonine/homoserine/homoserine lactone efflux protein